MATGDFDGDGKEDAVTGAPRGDGLTGKVGGIFILTNRQKKKYYDHGKCVDRMKK